MVEVEQMLNHSAVSALSLVRALLYDIDALLLSYCCILCRVNLSAVGH